ncbi:unnamed protein product [Adineta steineri]|uniref:Uncharacterized protein n=1 Tax=Adineta steineri TaxID=433720 RepID=A0A819TP51_9BILA|nr:unnamed protein product [Adineta steineri]
MDDFDPSGSLALNQSDVDKSPKRLIWCFWIFFLILLPLSSVVLIGFALFDSSITAYNDKGRMADILLMFTYVITIYGIIKIVLSITNSISIEHSTSVHTKKHSNIVFAFLFILGVGDSLFILTRFGDQLILIINQNFVPNSNCSTNLALSMTANFLKSLCQLCILMFILHQLDHSIKFTRKESKIFLTCLSIFCLIQWAQILLQEVHFHKNKPDACDMALDQGLKRFDEIAPYLYPLGLEFRFASFIELLIMSECLGTKFNETDGDHRAAVVHYDKNSLLTLINKLCEKEKSFEQIPYVQTVNMEFIVDFAILLISNLFLDIYCCVTLAGSVISEAEEQLTQTIRWLTLTASVIPIIQTTLQLIIIWKVRRYNGMLTKGINQMWIILSFAIWLFDTFSAKAYDTNEIQISVYSGGWDILAALFVPMSLFFRFHSCIMFANIKDGAYWDEEDHSLA